MSIEETPSYRIFIQDNKLWTLQDPSGKDLRIDIEEPGIAADTAVLLDEAVAPLFARIAELESALQFVNKLCKLDAHPLLTNVGQIALWAIEGQMDNVNSLYNNTEKGYRV